MFVGLRLQYGGSAARWGFAVYMAPAKTAARYPFSAPATSPAPPKTPWIPPVASTTWSTPVETVIRVRTGERGREAL